MKKDYYKTLEVDRNATEDEIKKSYRRLAKIHHPDKTGGTDSEEFKAISHAYQVLMDPKKRQMYDQFGDEDGPSQQSFGQGQHMNMFETIFNMVGGHNNRDAKPKVITLKVQLSTIINSGEFEIKYSRNVKCSLCEATGSKTKQSSVCHQCRGAKVVLQHMMVGPGISIPMQQPCPTCKGSGSGSVIDSDRCLGCKGDGTVAVDENVKVIVSAGLPPNFPNVHKLIELKDKGDYIRAQNKYSDVIVAVEIDETNLKNTKLKLPEGDIIMEVDISLGQALCGFTSFPFVLPSGETVTLQSSILLDPSVPFVIRKEGLFYTGHRDRRGDVVIKWNVVYPDSLDHNVMKELSKYLKTEKDDNTYMSTPRSITITK